MPARNSSWGVEEIAAAIDAYMDMLALQAQGLDFNKAAFNRMVREVATGRSHKSVEYKLCNISAILEAGGFPWIRGYAPLRNVQKDLRAQVFARLQNQPVMEEATPFAAPLRLVDPPKIMDAEEDGLFEALVREWDRTEWGKVSRYRRNLELGAKGEELVFEDERRRLRAIGRDDLADAVEWISRDRGDGAGYDIRSFTATEDDRLLEVKTTRRGRAEPFFITRNELEVSKQRSSEWRLVRLFDYGAPEVRKFELAPPLDRVSNLSCMTWEASFGSDRAGPPLRKTRPTPRSPRGEAPRPRHP